MSPPHFRSPPGSSPTHLQQGFFRDHREAALFTKREAVEPESLVALGYLRQEVRRPLLIVKLCHPDFCRRELVGVLETRLSGCRNLH